MYVILNKENNPVMDAGRQAFDIRNHNNRMCAYGQDEIMMLETPVRFGGGIFNVIVLEHSLFLMEIAKYDGWIK